MDHALTVNQMLKYFLVKENKIKGSPLDSEISNALKAILFEGTINPSPLQAADSEKDVTVYWFKWYDALRNYLTKKPQDDVKDNKLKLNFENGSLLGGWSDGQEKIKASVVLKKENDFYLGILKTRTLFDTEKENNSVYKNTTSGSGRLILANLKFQTLAGKGFLGEFGQSYGNMGTEDPVKAIQCLQKIIKDRYINKYPLLKKIAEKLYSTKKDFDKEIQETLVNCYVCEFTQINWLEVEKQTDLGNMYLFKIHSKDDGRKNTGNKNLQTLYWRAVFKKIKTGYGNKSFIIDNKRFTSEKFLFHYPIKLNYRAKSYSKPQYALSEINNEINKHFVTNDNIYFLGIDRGEKHLAYYSLIDQNGKIIDQETLNLPFTDKAGKPRGIKKQKYFYNKKADVWEPKEVDCWNYNDLLDAMASNRDMARKNWQTIGTIKELKEGYISQVVRKIVDLSTAKDKPVFIVLEDLNTGFKRGRQKIQKFELALAKKLNFLVDKSAKNGEIGSVTKALQLTPPVNNYGDIENKKQVGIMLYTRANYTSQTDPITGWRKSIRLKKGSEKDIKEQIIKEFTDIGFNGKDYYFECVDKNTGKQWKLYSGKDGKNLDRFRGSRGKDKNEWTIKPVDVASILDQVFINFNKNHSIHQQIIEGTFLEKTKEEPEITAWESLRFAIDVIQQIRNTGEDERDKDFIFSPVRDENGNHFDSRVYLDREKENIVMPSSGDANGAFNIARKGILMSEHILVWIKNRKPKYDKNTNDLSLFISEDEWDLYLTNREEWKKQLSKFSSRKAIEQARKAMDTKTHSL